MKKPRLSGLTGLGMPAESWQGSSLANYVSLMEFLSSTSVEGVLRKATGTLQISTGQGRWQGKLRDLEDKVYAFVTADTLDGLLTSLEIVCETGEADWRRDEWSGKKPGQK